MAYGVKIAKGNAYKEAARKRRHIRVRKRVTGSAERPRLVVTRSNRGITAQVIDDNVGHTLASASTLDTSIRGVDGDKSDKAAQVGCPGGRACQGRGYRGRRVRPWRQPVRRAHRRPGGRRSRSWAQVLSRPSLAKDFAA